MDPRRIIVAITGASGTILGVRLLEALRDLNVETHLILSRWGARTLIHETSQSVKDLEGSATVVHSKDNQGAAISSGSFLTDGMVIAPCSMKTLAEIAHGFGNNLISRAADVVLKERRTLVLMVREAPFHEIHLENMLKLARMGAVILPPVLAFYNHPRDLNEAIDHIVMRALDQFGLKSDLMKRWEGKMSRGSGQLT